MRMERQSCDGRELPNRFVPGSVKDQLCKKTHRVTWIAGPGLCQN